MISKKMENIGFWTAAVFILSAVFIIYSTYRQRYVGACDWYGYYQQAQLFKSGHVSLDTKLPASKYPAVAPLSFYSENGKVVGQYPPGFPLLMAVAGFVGLELYVNPILGILSVILMYLTILTLIGNDKWTAGLFALLWAFFPLTIYGSTYVMSDLPATFFILLAFYLFKKKKLIPSALSLAFSLAVRPSNVLFCVVFLPLVWQELKVKERWQYGSWFIISSSLYAIYNWLVYGLPWRTGYMDISQNLSATIFTRNMLFYIGEILAQFTPMLLLLAVIALWKKEKKKDKYVFFLTAWFLAFLIFYCFWKPFVNVWWWQRFLLPGFPALFLLAASGFKRILMDIRWPNKILNYAVSILLVAAVMSNGIYFIYRGNHYSKLWAKDKGKLFYAISKKIAKRVIPGSLVGSCDFTGSLRLYTNTETFGYYNLNSLYLISDLLKEGKPVYLAVEPWQKKNLGVQWIFKNFKLKKIANVGIETWSDFFLYRIMKQKYQDLLIPPL